MALYKHSCGDDCVFLGSYQAHDLYWCQQQVIKTPAVIARYGDDGPDYVSGLAIGMSVPLADLTDPQSSVPTVHLRALRVAFLIARDQGLIADPAGS